MDRTLFHISRQGAPNVIRKLVNGVYIDYGVSIYDPEALRDMEARVERSQEEQRQMYQTVRLRDFLALGVTQSGMTFNQIAEQLQVSPETVKRWVKGLTVPANAKMKALCGVLGLDYIQCRQIAGRDPVAIASVGASWMRGNA